MEAVRSTRGTAVAGGADGAAAAALVPATSSAAAVPGRGYIGCSFGSARLEVISITCAGEAVGCWLLATTTKKAV